MTTVGLAPISLREATLTVEADDYTAQVNEVTFVPEVEWMWHRTHLADIPIFLRVRWTVVIGYAQDLTTPGALSLYLFTNAAAVKTLTFTPLAGGPTITAEAMIVPGRIGGPSGQILTETVVLPLFDEPVIDTGES